VQARGVPEGTLGSWISGLQNWWRIRDACHYQNYDDRCFINHPLLLLSQLTIPHPLILQGNQGIQDLLDVSLSEFDETSAFRRGAGNLGRFGKFVHECSEMLIW
jgi:hypothetical protein